jgi:hypothetical protein
MSRPTVHNAGVRLPSPLISAWQRALMPAPTLSFERSELPARASRAAAPRKLVQREHGRLPCRRLLVVRPAQPAATRPVRDARWRSHGRLLRGQGAARRLRLPPRGRSDLSGRLEQLHGRLNGIPGPAGRRYHCRWRRASVCCCHPPAIPAIEAPITPTPVVVPRGAPAPVVAPPAATVGQGFGADTFHAPTQQPAPPSGETAQQTRDRLIAEANGRSVTASDPAQTTWG